MLVGGIYYLLLLVAVRGRRIALSYRVFGSRPLGARLFAASSHGLRLLLLSLPGLLLLLVHSRAAALFGLLGLAVCTAVSVLLWRARYGAPTSPEPGRDAWVPVLKGLLWLYFAQLVLVGLLCVGLGGAIVDPTDGNNFLVVPVRREPAPPRSALPFVGVWWMLDPNAPHAE